VFDLLFVCTGNICRSPTAELVAAHRLPPEHFRVHSAGTYGLHGYPIEPAAARLLGPLGIGYDAFRARRLDAGLVAGADLVLGMAREHRTAVVTTDPRALPKTFTLRELARLVEGIDPATLPDGDPADRARAVVALAAERRGRAWAPPEEDDVADPYGRGAEAYERAFSDITAALDRALLLMAG
jgi:protein-tyrosine phosphatase